MEQKRGKTGLTQKDAIFQIVCEVLGDRYTPGEEVENLIANKTFGDIRPRWNSPDLDKMINLVCEGLINGTIPSKYNSDADRTKVREYSNRITHYWIRNDRRLNGGMSGTRVARKKKREIILQTRFKYDPQLQALQDVLEKCDNKADRLEVETYLMGRMFGIILDTFEIDKEEIPLGLRKLLKLENSSQQPNRKKKAA